MSMRRTTKARVSVEMGFIFSEFLLCLFAALLLQATRHASDKELLRGSGQGSRLLGGGSRRLAA